MRWNGRMCVGMAGLTVAVALTGCTPHTQESTPIPATSSPAAPVSRVPLTQTPFDPPLNFDVTASVALPEGLEDDVVLEGVELYTHEVNSPAVVAVDVRTGEILWRSELEPEVRICRQQSDGIMVYTLVTTSKKLSDGTSGVDYSVVAMQISNGEVAWRSPATEFDPEYSNGCLSAVLTLTKAGVMLSSSSDVFSRTTWMFDTITGALAWTAPGRVLAHDLSGPAGGYGALIIQDSSDQGVWAIDLATGRIGEQLLAPVMTSLPPILQGTSSTRITFGSYSYLPDGGIFAEFSVSKPELETAYYHFDTVTGTLVGDPLNLDAQGVSVTGCVPSDAVMVCTNVQNLSHPTHAAITAFTMVDGTQLWSRDVDEAYFFTVFDQAVYLQPPHESPDSPWYIVDVNTGQDLATVSTMAYPLAFNEYGAVVTTRWFDEASNQTQIVLGSWIPAIG